MIENIHWLMDKLQGMIKHTISLQQTGLFSNLVLDYISGKKQLESFITEFPSKEAIRHQLHRKSFTASQRQLLHQSLSDDYQTLEPNDVVQQQLDALLHPNTFTVTTAHQPVLFLGPLYIVYKILHTKALCKSFQNQFPDYQFVPVFYIGSEDHDLEEIGSLHVHQKTFSWQTNQTGACGEMTCEGLLDLWEDIKKEITVDSFLDNLVKKAYQPHHTISYAYRILLHTLFGKHGLLVFDANKPSFKKAFVSVLEDELNNQSSYRIVNEHNQVLSQQYTVQAQPRPINLFYKTPGQRNRIERNEEGFQVVGSSITFSEASMRQELATHPERFSPNVILRPLLQETVLPNVAWIGGGGELAYWLQLKTLFEHYNITYPILYLRQSFMLLSGEKNQRRETLQLSWEQLFTATRKLLSDQWMASSKYQTLQTSVENVLQHFDALKKQASDISPNLLDSMQAHEAKAKKILHRVQEKFSSHWIKNQHAFHTQVDELKEPLFPKGQLQERYTSFLDMYSSFGSNCLDEIYANLDPDQTAFTMLVAS